MKIAIISLVFPPESGAAKYPADLALQLAASEHSVSIVTGFPSYPKGMVFPGYKKRILDKTVWREKIRLHRVWLYTSPKRDSFLHRLLHYLSFTFSAIYGTLALPKQDVIFVFTPPYFLTFAGWMVKIITGAKLVVDVQDFWPEAPIALGMIRNSLLIRFLLWTERLFYKKCDLIIALSPVMKNKIAARGIPEEKIAVVYNWADLTGRTVSSNEDLRRVLGLEDKFIFLFAGNFGQAQGLSVFLNTADKLRQETKIHFIFLGDGIEKEKLQNIAAQKNLSNVSFVNTVPADEVFNYYALADVLISHLIPYPHREAAIPSKTQGYMASGKPIISAVAGATAEIITHANCGWNVEPNNAEAMAKAVFTAMETPPEELNNLGANGRRFAEQNFNMSEQCKKIEQILIQLRNNPPK